MWIQLKSDSLATSQDMEQVVASKSVHCRVWKRGEIVHQALWGSEKGYKCESFGVALSNNLTLCGIWKMRSSFLKAWFQSDGAVYTSWCTVGFGRVERRLSSGFESKLSRTQIARQHGVHLDRRSVRTTQLCSCLASNPEVYVGRGQLLAFEEKKKYLICWLDQSCIPRFACVATAPYCNRESYTWQSLELITLSAHLWCDSHQ